MADNVEKYISKEDIKEYAMNNRVLARSAKKLYSLVLGHCTKGLHAKMKAKEDRKKIYDKRNSVELLNMIKKIAFKVNSGKTIYMTTRKIKRDTANLLQNNDTPYRYIDKFIRNVQVAKHKEFGI